MATKLKYSTDWVDKESIVTSAYTFAKSFGTPPAPPVPPAPPAPPAPPTPPSAPLPPAPPPTALNVD